MTVVTGPVIPHKRCSPRSSKPGGTSLTQDCWVCVSTRDFAEACLKDEPMSMVVPRSPIVGGEHANTQRFTFSLGADGGVSGGWWVGKEC